VVGNHSWWQAVNDLFFLTRQIHGRDFFDAILAG
jgi:hypothetical protein